MKWNCELIQDLLPLYEEDLCSPASRQAVEEHLRECERCRRLNTPLPAPEPEIAPTADQAVARSIRKVRRRWLTSLIAAALVVPMLLLSMNQLRGCGLCFTNVDDALTAWRFLHALETQAWEKAAALHDYTRDYESILDALAEPLAPAEIPFAPCDLAGYDYMAHAFPESGSTATQTIHDLYGYLYNREGTAMIPLALWEQLIALDPTAFSSSGWQYWLNGELYGKITTPWGDFVVSEGRGFDTAYDYAVYFDLIPAAVYVEALPALEAEALRVYTDTHNHYGFVADMTEAEFIEYMERRYAEELRGLEDTVSFDCTGLRTILRYGDDADSWYVSLAVTITQSGKTLDVQIDLGVADGKIIVVSISHEPDALLLDAVNRALYPSAHPGY